MSEYVSRLNVCRSFRNLVGGGVEFLEYFLHPVLEINGSKRVSRPRDSQFGLWLDSKVEF